MEAVGLIEGEVPAVAMAAVIIGALVADVAVGCQPRLGAVALEAGVVLAVGADDAGAVVALFLPAVRPA